MAFGEMRFSTSDLPRDSTDADRAAAWTQALGAEGGQFEMRTPRVEAFFGVVVIRMIGDLQVGSAMCSSADMARTRERVLADNDDRILLIVNRGATDVAASQFGKRVSISPGDVCIFDFSQPLECRAVDGGHLLHALIPRRLLEGLELAAVCAAPLSGRSGVGRVLRSLLSELAQRQLDQDLGEVSGIYLAQLLRALLAERETEPPPKAINHVRLMRVRALIRERFADPDFSLAAAAAEVGVSERHVQALFAADGETFSEVLNATRLDAAFSMLKARTDRPLRVADIALSSGYPEMSTFYRRFNARFGRSPARVRSEAASGDQT